MYGLILKVIIIILALFPQTAIGSSSYDITDQTLISQIIAVDPGHGGYDPGAVFGKVHEKDINLILSKKIKKQFENSGFFVVLTRNGDYNYAIKGLHGNEAKRYDLTQRIKIINSSKAKMLLTVHVNSSKKTAYAGAEAFYYPNSSRGKILADYIQEELKGIPGMQKRLPKTSKCFMLRNTKVPAVLIEIGYLSNSKERKRLQDPEYLNLIAEKITVGLIKYYDVQEI